ncbi:MAG: reverse transcriptase-like protein [Thermincolia bacterium]
MQVLKVFTDGASRGNPGEAGIGVAIYGQDSEILVEIGEYIGVATNNVAEYTAMIRGLQAAKKLGGGKVEIYADSELMIKQMKGLYKVKNEGLQPLYRQAQALCQELDGCTFTHVPREKNKRADALANKGIDNKGKKGAVQQVALEEDQGLFENVFPEARGTTGNNFRRDEKLSVAWVEESETEVRSWVRVAPGISREILAVGEKMMLVKFNFKKGALVARHSHPHEQSSYIVQGKLLYKIGDEELVLEKGEGIIIPGGVEHEAVALEDTVDVNTFVPVREDFL